MIDVPTMIVACVLILRPLLIHCRRDAIGSAVPGSINRFLHAIKTLIVFDVQLTKEILLVLIGMLVTVCTC